MLSVAMAKGCVVMSEGHTAIFGVSDHPVCGALVASPKFS